MKINEVVLERRGGRGRKKTGKGRVRNTNTGTPSVQSPAEKEEELQATPQPAPQPTAEVPQQPAPQPAPQQPQPAPQKPQGPNLWNRIKQGAGAAAQGVKNFKQSRANSPQQKQGAELAKRFSQRWLNQWNQNVGADPSSNTPEELKSFMTRAFSDKLRPEQIPLPTKMDPAYVAKYIQLLSGKYISQPRGGAQVDQGSTPQTMPQPKQPAPTQQLGAQQSGNLAPNVSVVSQEPIVIKYDNQDYGLDDKGQWVHLRSGKVTPESMQAFLSKQHDTSLGL